MNIASIAIALIVVFIGLAYRQSISEENVKGITTVQTLSPTVKSAPTESISNSPSPMNNPTSIPTPAVVPQNVKENQSTWIYTPSRVKDQNTQSMHLTTDDDPTKVTNWYEAKIKNLQLPIQTFVKTTTNNVTNNTLDVAKANQTIRIQIQKTPDTQTDISIEFSY